MKRKKIGLIKGGRHSDQRGVISFVNDFDMSVVRRFYIIENADTRLVRGWRAHRIEQRWFYTLQGSFQIKTIEIDNWKSPSKALPKEEYVLSEENQAVLHVPDGYATAIKALEEHSRLLVFADYGLENALNDDHVYPLGYFGF